MQDYNPHNSDSRRWGIAATVAYAAVVYMLLAYAGLWYNRKPSTSEKGIVVEFTAPPEEQTPPPPPAVTETAPAHERLDVRDNSRQVSGTDEKTQTVNPKALFKMNKGGADAPESVGNPFAQKGESDLAKGNGGGLKPEGNEFLDRGLQGRGLAGALPRPDYPGNQSGTVVVRVTVNRSGEVMSATYEPKGSTTSEAALVEAAVRAAQRARFVESRAFVQGGTITYVFKIR